MSLPETDRLYLQAVDTDRIAILTLDTALTIRTCTPSLENFSDQSAREVEGREVTVLGDELRSYLTELRRLTRSEQEEVLLETVGATLRDGREVYKSYRFLAQRDDEGRVSGIVLYLEDVTTRILMEQQIVQAHNELHLAKRRLEELSSLLHRQDELKSVLLSIIPVLLQEAAEGRKEFVLQRLCDEADRILLERTAGHPDSEEVAGSALAASTLLNDLGGGFTVSSHERGAEVQVHNTKCPWGDAAQRNPIFCSLTHALFARSIVRNHPRTAVFLDRTIANGDGHCRVRIQDAGAAR